MTFISVASLKTFTRFVKDLDKLEMMNQALSYQKETKIDLSDFFRSTEGKIKTESGKILDRELREGKGLNSVCDLHSFGRPLSGISNILEVKVLLLTNRKHIFYCLRDKRTDLTSKNRTEET